MKMTLRDALDRYLKSMKQSSNHRNLVTMSNKMTGIGMWEDIYHLPADLCMSDLRTAHVSQLKEERLDEGLKPASVNLELKVLQRVYNLCRKEWDVDVGRKEVFFKLLKTTPKVRYLSEDEETQVLQYLLLKSEGTNTMNVPQHSYMKAYVLAIFLLDTGCRLGEVLTLPRAEINLNKGVINVYRSKTSSYATIGVTKRLRGGLESVLDDSGHLVLNNMSRAVRHLRGAIRKVCNSDPLVVERSGVATIHSLRDTFASRLVQNGMSLHEVSKLLGHTSLAMTVKYAHLEGKDTTLKAVSVMDNLRRVG